MAERREPVRLHLDTAGFTKSMTGAAAMSEVNRLSGRLRYLADAAAVLGPMLPARACACLSCRVRRLFRWRR